MKERLSIVDSETASKIDKMTYLEVIDAYLEEKVLLGNDSPIYPYEIQSAKEMGSYERNSYSMISAPLWALKTFKKTLFKQPSSQKIDGYLRVAPSAKKIFRYPK